MKRVTADRWQIQGLYARSNSNWGRWYRECRRARGHWQGIPASNAAFQTAGMRCNQPRHHSQSQNTVKSMKYDLNTFLLLLPSKGCRRKPRVYVDDDRSRQGTPRPLSCFGLRPASQHRHITYAAPLSSRSCSLRLHTHTHTHSHCPHSVPLYLHKLCPIRQRGPYAQATCGRKDRRSASTGPGNEGGSGLHGGSDLSSRSVVPPSPPPWSMAQGFTMFSELGTRGTTP